MGKTVVDLGAGTGSRGTVPGLWRALLEKGRARHTLYLNQPLFGCVCVCVCVLGTTSISAGYLGALVLATDLEHMLPLLHGMVMKGI